MAFELGVLGVGHLAGAVLEGAFEHGVLTPESIIVADHQADRREHFAGMGCAVAEQARGLRVAPRILCAVRPQDFAVASDELGPLDETHLVISVMAGIDSATIRSGLGGACRVIRTMPNTGAMLGCSMTAVAPGPGAIESDITFVNSLFGAIGRTVDIEESLLSAATAVSGSGPGWVYLLASAMVDAAVEVGFDPGTADTMTRQTILAAARCMAEGDTSVASLLQGIASKGGTTEAGLSAMAEHGFAEAVLAGIVAARDRGDALGAEGQ